MEIHIHVHHHNAGDDKVLSEIKSINLNLTKMAEELKALQQEVAENKTVMQSAVTLLQGLKQKLDEAGTDATALKALSDELDANTNSLAAAVTANTPAENEQPGDTAGTETTNG